MHSRRFDSGRRRLQIEQGAAATGAGDVVGFENARPGCLQNVVAQAQRLTGRFFALH